MSTAIVVRALTRARDKIITKGWTKGGFAVNANGEAVPVHSKSAAKFCAMGAVYSVTGHGGARDAAMDLLYSEVWKAGVAGVPEFNDKPTTRKSTIISLFNRAIKAAKAGE